MKFGWRHVVILGFFSALFGCVEEPGEYVESGDESGGEESANSDSDSDGDADSDSDSDGDSDGDGDTDENADADTDGDTDGDTDTDADGDTDTDADTDGDADADGDMDADTDGDTDADGDSDADSDTDTDADSDADTETDTTPETEETETDTPTGSDTGTGTEAGPSFNICDETVPEEHYVDAIPAYSQCDASRNGAIWSDDGVNTSVESLGDGWERTQWSGGYQCTEFAHRYLFFVWGIQSVPNGNAGQWCDGTPPDGLEISMEPVHGDVVVFAGGSCGADPTTGHVAVVDEVNEAASSVTFVEQNMVNRRTCGIDTAACFLHAEANDGAGPS